jgi:hypothetical protein
MEGPTVTDEASIPTEPEKMIRALKRKAAKRTCFAPSLPAEHIKSSPDEDVPARKKPRLQASLPAIAAEADSLNASADAIVAVASSTDAGTDPAAASPVQRNIGATRAPPRFWTPEEDTKLTTAVETTCKKKQGEEYRTDWVAVAALVPGRTNKQCYIRWHDTLHSKSDEITVRNGVWTTDEDAKLKDAVEKYSGKNWAAISSLVPGRTKKQCYNRGHDVLLSKSDETTVRMGTWTTEEDTTLKDAVQKHDGKNWAAISSMVPGRTRQQCLNRWRNALVHSKSDETTERKGKWTTEEDSTLKDAVEKHNGKNWAAISELVPGRTNRQCCSRWVKYLDPSRITITEEEHGTTNEASALG